MSGQLLLCLGLLVVQGGAVGQNPTERSLADYTNDDGRPPDGRDDATDDTRALLGALGDGPGIVRIPAGHYRVGEVCVPTGVTLVGAGPATVLRSNGAKCILQQRGVRDFSIRDLTLDGEATGPWQQRTDEGQSGIAVERCSHFTISGIALRNFGGAALQLSRTGVDGAPVTHGGNLQDITATGSFIGVRFDVRAEYINATRLHCEGNVTGCVIHGGNCKVTDSNFVSNLDGIFLQDKENGSHGVLSACLSNHNVRYALLADKVANGMAINGCCFFYGEVLIRDCVGIQLAGGILSCTVRVQGAGVNRISDNYMIPREGLQFEFSPATIVDGNFSAEGLWTGGR